MKIVVEGDVAYIYTPYNPVFVERIKGIGGAKWIKEQKCWRIPCAAVEAARVIMTDVYGHSDVTANETISLRVTIAESISALRSDVVLFGKVLSHASGRDSGARVGDDVAYISGGATSGGSVKNWCSVVKEGSVAILSNVNKAIYKRAEMEYDGVTVEVIAKKANKQDLLDEKERLLKRIAEIEKLLQEVG